MQRNKQEKKVRKLTQATTFPLKHGNTVLSSIISSLTTLKKNKQRLIKFLDKICWLDRTQSQHP